MKYHLKEDLIAYTLVFLPPFLLMLCLYGLDFSFAAFIFCFFLFYLGLLFLYWGVLIFRYVVSVLTY